MSICAKNVFVALLIVPLVICLGTSCTSSTSTEKEVKVNSVKVSAIKPAEAEKEIELTPEQLQEVDKDVESIVVSAKEKEKKTDATPKRDEKKVAECKRGLRDKVTNARKLFNSKGSAHYHDTAWLNTVLANARNEYDACMAIANN
ncbi:hypothetical protein [uncultured Gimesia sp.]|uniref:hypothetical protein n=1 Tax=uncultured Gimesia sp. TaxID=1678688 RepID=UPI00262ECB3B|nr:hypothetical protein [uncultured Gimesia sp.]